MKAIGKAEIGDKTILDSLWPGIENLKENEDKDITIVKAYKEAYEAAEEGGALNTKHMISNMVELLIMGRFYRETRSRCYCRCTYI